MTLVSRIAFSALCSIATVPAPCAEQTSTNDALKSVSQFTGYQVVELRRYDIAPGQRDRFVAYFDAYFPEAFEQLGSMVYGQFYDRSAPTKFTWLRGFKDMNARANALAEFYYGPVWQEHRSKVNALFPGASDNVLLLRPLNSNTAVSVFPAVDPIDEVHDQRGVVVMQIFPVRKGSEDAFARQAQAQFEHYRTAGIRQAGVLVTLDAVNNFPQLPIRTDGPFLVWIGVVDSDSTLAERFLPLEMKVEKALTASRLLRGSPERLILDPSPRSRLRWWPQGK